MRSLDSPRFRELRRRMVEEQIIARGVKDPRVIEAMLRVPRHLFVPRALQEEAYNDYPLPIGRGQTISQPYMVAAMTEALEVNETHRVLEIGTGSGYQAAILAEIAREVYTIERLEELAERAERLLKEVLGYENVHVRVGDGTLGWPEHAPYDRIMVTAAAPEPPPPLLDQLQSPGIMVIPLGDLMGQMLTRVIKDREGEVRQEELFPCAFVPLVGKYGF